VRLVFAAWANLGAAIPGVNEDFAFAETAFTNVF